MLAAQDLNDWWGDVTAAGGVLAHLFFHSYSWINGVFHAATVEAIKKS